MIPQETGNGTDGAGVGGIYERNGELMRWLVETFACFRGFKRLFYVASWWAALGTKLGTVDGIDLYCFWIGW